MCDLDDMMMMSLLDWQEKNKKSTDYKNYKKIDLLLF